MKNTKLKNKIQADHRLINKLQLGWPMAILSSCMVLSFNSIMLSDIHIVKAASSASSSSSSVSNSSTNSSVSEEEKNKVLKKVDKIEDKIIDKQEDLKELEQKAANYQKMINLKKQQQQSLKNQLDFMSLQEDNLSNNLLLAQKAIQENISQIDQLQQVIDMKEKEMEDVKSKLAEMIRSFSQIDEELAMELLATQGDISTILNNSEYLDQSSQKVSQVLEQVQQKKLEIEDQRHKLEEKDNELKTKKNDLEEKSYYLDNEQKSKSYLLKQTAGEEAKYQQLLERVEQQKQDLIGDIDELSDDKKNKLAQIQAEASTPKSGIASQSWYYSQKDSRWGYNRIGLSSSLIKDYGCALTSVAMVFSYHGKSITPGKMAQQPIFYRDLIVWPKTWEGLSISEDGHAHGNINWSTVDAALKARRPVIVFVRASAGKGHYVVVVGKDKKGQYVVHDPLFGPNIYLETTKKLVGAIYNSSTTIDQMIIYE